MMSKFLYFLLGILFTILMFSVIITIPQFFQEKYQYRSFNDKEYGPFCDAFFIDHDDPDWVPRREIDDIVITSPNSKYNFAGYIENITWAWDMKCGTYVLNSDGNRDTYGEYWLWPLDLKINTTYKIRQCKYYNDIEFFNNETGKYITTRIPKYPDKNYNMTGNIESVWYENSTIFMIINIENEDRLLEFEWY